MDPRDLLAKPSHRPGDAGQLGQTAIASERVWWGSIVASLSSQTFRFTFMCMHKKTRERDQTRLD